MELKKKSGQMDTRSYILSIMTSNKFTQVNIKLCIITLNQMWH